MKLALTGKIVWVGNNCVDESPRASILLNSQDVDGDLMSLEVDLAEAEAMQLAQHLYGEVRICIEVVPKPKIVG